MNIDKYIDQFLIIYKDCESESTLYDELFDMFEDVVLSKVLIATYGNQSKAARVLGMSRGALINKLNRLKDNESRFVTKEKIHEQYEKESKELFEQFEKDHVELTERFETLSKDLKL